LIEKSDQALIEKELKKILKTGTTTIGAISSYGFDLQPCLNTPLNVVFFNEVIGSKPEMIDTLFSDFKARLNQTLKHKSKRFIPAIAVHSPYSVHPFLLREVLSIAKEKKLCVTAHFLESNEEKEWLKDNTGGFLDFFMKLLGQNQSVTSSMEFLEQFKQIEPLSFTHCLQANNEELKKIAELNGVINHCPTSNRLLNNSKLDLKKLKESDVVFSIGTDGLSSNNSLSMFDELRNALMIHANSNITKLSKKLLKAATLNGARALGLNKGSLEKGKQSDMIAFCLPDAIKNKEEVAMHIILHTKYVNKTIIGGEDV
ncbi:MAG: aminofutalosine deaminase family hydrolase, partial [Arcobacteraceae bacterium]